MSTLSLSALCRPVRRPILAPLAACLLLFLAPAGLCLAAEGELDLTFGLGTGIIKGEIPANPASGVDLAVQPDGRILMAGVRGGANQGFVARFREDGSFDPSFGNDGIVRMDFPSPSSSNVRIVLQPDGSILLAGVNIAQVHYVARLDSGGVLDPAFGTAGVAETGVSSDFQSAVALSLQPDGRILLAGHGAQMSQNFVARIDATGALDPDFGIGGVTYAELPSDQVSGVDVGIQPDGKIVLVGVALGSGEAFATRFEANGTTDTTFGSQGTALTGVLCGIDAEVGLALQADGKVLLAGWDELERDGIIARFTGDGVMDPTFGTSGVVHSEVGSRATSGVDLAVQPDGKIVFAGNATAADVFTLRFDANGARDFSYGPGEIAIRTRPEADVRIVLQADDKAVVATVTDVADRGVVARFDLDGNLDLTLGVRTGVARTGLFSERDSGVDVLARPDGGILLAGIDPYQSEAYIARFDATGMLDSSFGTEGIARSGLFSDIFGDVGIVAQADGKILLAGSDLNTSEHFIARFDATGLLDPTFGTDGIARSGLTTFGSSSVDLAVLPSGEIVLAGNDDSFGQSFVARFDADGLLDPGYGSEGAAFVWLPSNAEGDVAVTFDSDGRILLAGLDESRNEAFVARFDDTGEPDFDFGFGAGFVHSQIPGHPISGVGMVVQADGRIILSGIDSGPGECFVVRFDSNGDSDPTFGSAGVARTGISTSSISDVGITVQENGRIIVAGIDGSLGEGYLARFDETGVLDSGFGAGGIGRTGLDSEATTTVELALQADGHILLAGHDAIFQQNFVARFEGTPTETSGTELPSARVNEMVLTTAPNPCSDHARVSFDLPTSEFVRIDLFAVSGQRVRTLVRERLDRGSHTFELGTGDLAGGTYFLRLQSKRTQTTRRLAVMR